MCIKKKCSVLHEDNVKRQYNKKKHIYNIFTTLKVPPGFGWQSTACHKDGLFSICLWILFVSFCFPPRLRTCSKCNKQGGGEQAQSQSDNFKCQQLRQATLPSFGKRKERVWRILMKYSEETRKRERGKIKIYILFRNLLEKQCAAKPLPYIYLTKPLYGESGNAC